MEKKTRTHGTLQAPAPKTWRSRKGNCGGWISEFFPHATDLRTSNWTHDFHTCYSGKSPGPNRVSVLFRWALVKGIVRRSKIWIESSLHQRQEQQHFQPCSGIKVFVRLCFICSNETRRTSHGWVQEQTLAVYPGNTAFFSLSRVSNALIIIWGENLAL